MTTIKTKVTYDEKGVYINLCDRANRVHGSSKSPESQVKSFDELVCENL